MTTPRRPAPRTASAVEAAAVERALRSSRGAVQTGTGFLLAVALGLGVFGAVNESVGVGVLIGTVMTAVALGLPAVLRHVRRQRPTDHVEPLAGELAQVPSVEGTYGYLLGSARVNVPSHWRPYLPDGADVRAEGLRVDVPGRPPVYHLVTAEAPTFGRDPLSVEREAEAGLGGPRNGVRQGTALALVVLGTPLVLAGLGLALVFSGFGGRETIDSAWATGWAVVAAVALVAVLVGTTRALRFRSQVWSVYHGPGTLPPPPLGPTAWAVAGSGALAMALGLWLFGVPPWAGALVGAVGFLPAGILVGGRPGRRA